MSSENSLVNNFCYGTKQKLSQIMTLIKRKPTIISNIIKLLIVMQGLVSSNGRSYNIYIKLYLKFVT